MISGFVLTHAHSKEEKLSIYFVTRLLRLWPLVFISTMSMIIIYWFHKEFGGYLPQEDIFNWRLWLKNISLTHGVFFNDFYVINGPAWSISIELWASLLIPVIFVKLNVLARFVVSALIFLALAWNSGTGLGSNGFWGMYNFIYAISSMLLGSACYSFFSSRNSDFKSYKYVEVFMWVSLFTCLLGIFAQPAHSNRIDYYFILAFVPLMGVDFLKDDSLIKRLMNSSLLQFFGYISFPLYLLHFPVLITGVIYQGSESPNIAILMFVSISILVSYIYTTIVDIPLYRYLKRKIIPLMIERT